MIKPLLLLTTVLFSLGGKTQIVKFLKNPVTAQYRVFISNKSTSATHWIYRVADLTDIRRPGDWHILPSPQLFKSAVTLYEVEERKEADWIVYYVARRD